MAEATWSSSELTALLEVRHPPPQWATVAECRDATGFNARRTIDFAAINTWNSGVRSAAYEIKVSRSDFHRELAQPEKRAWVEAEFVECWFVAPRGVIVLEELPEGWGLLEPAGDKLRSARKALQRTSNKVDAETLRVMIRRSVEDREKLRKEAAEFAEFRGAKASIDLLRRLALKLSGRGDKPPADAVALLLQRRKDLAGDRYKAERELRGYEPILRPWFELMAQQRGLGYEARRTYRPTVDEFRSWLDERLRPANDRSLLRNAAHTARRIASDVESLREMAATLTKLAEEAS